MNRSDRIPNNRCTLFRATKAGIHQFESNWSKPQTQLRVFFTLRANIATKRQTLGM